MNNISAITISIFDKQVNTVNSIFLYLLLAVFCVFLMLTIFVCEFYRRRKFFLLFGFGLDLAYLGTVWFLGKTLALVFLPTGFSLVLYGVLCVLPKKEEERLQNAKKSILSDEKDDEQPSYQSINEKDDEQPSYQSINEKDDEKSSIQNILDNDRQGVISNAEQFLQKIKRQQKEEDFESQNPQQELKNGIDFSHVISILNKLSRFGLSESDGKVIEELKQSLNLANEGNCDIELKTKINDGLSALLKIMAKYSL